MPNLYELTDEAKYLTALMADPELDDEQREAVLAKHREVTQEDLPKKLEARAIVIQNLKADAEQQKLQADYHARRAKAAKADAKWLDYNTKRWLEVSGLKNYRAGIFTLSPVGCGGPQAMEIIPDLDVALLPDEFVTVIPEQRVPNKDALHEALVQGRPVPLRYETVKASAELVALSKEGDEIDAVHREPCAKLLPRGT